MSKQVLVLATVFILALIGLIVGLTAFANRKSLPKGRVSQTKTPDMQNLLAQFLVENQKSITEASFEKVKEAYQFALENPGDILDKMPCYCGCMKTHGHKSNRDCFIKNKEEQKIGEYFDKMGLNCGTCVAIAIKTKELYQQGKPAEEIKAAIDRQFLIK